MRTFKKQVIMTTLKIVVFPFVLIISLVDALITNPFGIKN
jgi:hypothetical protein